MNPVSFFEIPVLDMDRALGFYAVVFGLSCERLRVPGKDMALLPHADGTPGISGALVQGRRYVPGGSGARIFMNVANIESVLFKAAHAGGAVLRAESTVGGYGDTAEIADSEGNRIALYAARPVARQRGMHDGGGLFGGDGGKLRPWCDCC
jgi:predicted enzyme related to lactoylglutathione lyase